MKLQLATSVFSRPTYALPELGCLNVYGEETPFGLALLPRPALTSRATVGTGPIRGVFRQKGVFAGSTFAVSGTELYRGTTLVGTVSGNSMVRWAASNDQLVVVDPGSGKAWWFNGATLAQITDPDLPPVIDCKILNGRAYFAGKNSDQIWFSDLAQVESVDGLAFFTAESHPDNAVALEVLGNQLWVFNEETTEIWDASGDADAPLNFVQKMDVGCLSQASVCFGDGKLYWLSNQRSFVEMGARISTPTIDEQLRVADTDARSVTAFPIKRDNHWLVGWNVPGRGTWVFGVKGRGWVQWACTGRQVFRANCGVVSDGEPYLGDDETGTVWKFNETQQLDGSTRISQKVSAFIEYPGQRQRVPPITFQAVMGQGEHTDPEAELRISRDRGRTWEDWQSRSLGQQGDYDIKATWHRQGHIDSNGILLEIRHSENILSAALGLELGARP